MFRGKNLVITSFSETYNFKAATYLEGRNTFPNTALPQFCRKIH